ncbi:uncharacterized protein [Prorops nasuta]|uniref:uncharacterized protein n=1 Tax=Prorops nasuta TaxID=863751 RepID=UPI0034CF4668
MFRKTPVIELNERMFSLSEDFLNLVKELVCAFRDSSKLLMEIVFDVFARTLELMLALVNLAFHASCFILDLCICTIQTFMNIFRGIVRIVHSIRRDEVEDFVLACIVILLWIGAYKCVANIINKKPRLGWAKLFRAPKENNNTQNISHKEDSRGSKIYPSRTTTRKNNHANKRSPMRQEDYDFDYL